MALLEGKKGLILGIANDRSIAAAIAKSSKAHGATFAVTNLPGEKFLARTKKAMDNGGYGEMPLFGLDVADDASLDDFFAKVKDEMGTIDFVVHSLAFANKDYLAIDKFLETPRDVFGQALDISAYSLIEVARRAQPLMNEGGSIIAMTYLGSDRAVPGYNVMGVAKAALESTSRYLAYELGPKGIRVNTISAGPVRTLSAMAVGGIGEMFDHTTQKAPLRRNIDAEEVGKAAVYLLSDLSSGTTGENLYVDSGFNIVGL
ncbi:MAG: enoyl-ACP reductase [Planctomycetota bacterium]